jgi:thiamine-phosphate pyrophosphorylase
MALDLRLIVITDASLAAPRSVEDVVRQALEAGAPAIQLRDKNADAAGLFAQARRLLRLTRRHGALLFVNDRLDVAMAARADGVHLGPDDLPVGAARAIAPRGFLIGFSADDPAAARHAVDAGADYIGCGAVFGTSTKPEAAGESIGIDQLDRVTRAVPVPVVGIGGIGPGNIHEIAATHAAGAAVVGAVMAAEEPRVVVTTMLDALSERVRMDPGV